MMQSTYDVLTSLWRDNDAEVQRIRHLPDQQGHVNGLMSANARIRAAMAGMPRNEVPPPDLTTAPAPQPDEHPGATIDAEPGDGESYTQVRLRT